MISVILLNVVALFLPQILYFILLLSNKDKNLLHMVSLLEHPSGIKNEKHMLHQQYDTFSEKKSLVPTGFKPVTFHSAFVRMSL
jgi:hypothetical protein